MADTWIESHVNIRTNKKLKPLCDELKISRAQAIGHLHMLWWWVIENRENGDLSSLFPRDIALACDWTGDPDKLIKALKRHRWLTSDMKINDWETYAGPLLRDRMRKRAAKTRILSGIAEDNSRNFPGKLSEDSAPTVTVTHNRNHNPSKGSFKRPSGPEPVGDVLRSQIFNGTGQKIKNLLAKRLGHEAGSEANEVAFRELTDAVLSDATVKDPIAVALHRAEHGFLVGR